MGSQGGLSSVQGVPGLSVVLHDDEWCQPKLGKGEISLEDLGNDG